MIIIAESGATKCDWVVADGGQVRLRFKTLGLNVATGAVSVIPPVVKEAVNTLKENGISCSDVREIHFYAAGLIPVRDEKVPEMAKPLDAVLREYFPDIDINMPLICWMRPVPSAAGKKASRPSSEPAPTAVSTMGRRLSRMSGRPVLSWATRAVEPAWDACLCTIS